MMHVSMGTTRRPSGASDLDGVPPPAHHARLRGSTRAVLWGQPIALEQARLHAWPADSKGRLTGRVRTCDASWPAVDGSVSVLPAQSSASAALGCRATGAARVVPRETGAPSGARR